MLGKAPTKTLSLSLLLSRQLLAVEVIVVASYTRTFVDRGYCTTDKYTVGRYNYLVITHHLGRSHCPAEAGREHTQTRE